jgi:hypothetical protein
VSDVCAWLASQGFQELVPMFKDNDINGRLLLELTQDQLLGEFSLAKDSVIKLKGLVWSPPSSPQPTP